MTERKFVEYDIEPLTMESMGDKNATTPAEVHRDMVSLRVLLNDYYHYQTALWPGLADREMFEELALAQFKFCDRFLNMMHHSFSDPRSLSTMSYPMTLADLRLFTQAHIMVYDFMRVSHEDTDEVEATEVVPEGASIN